jgi:hypothetical protein
MLVWLFSGSDNLVALCADRMGTGLPSEHGPWSYLREVALDHDGTDEEQARTLIREHGYCCFTASGHELVSADDA